MNLSKIARTGLHLLFWPWNVVLCAVAVFGYVPLALKDQVIDAVDGLARWDFVGGSVVLCLVPLVTTGYAFAHRARYAAHPLDLAELFFGVELPLLAITAARLFGFHQLSNAAQFVYVALVAGGLVAESRLVLGKRFPQGQLADGVSHMVLTLRFIAGTYVGFLLANITIPLILMAVVAVVGGGVPGGALVFGVVVFPVTLFVLATALLVLTLPITAPLSWFIALKESGREVQKKWGYDDLLFTSGAPVVVAVIGFVLLVPQPHAAATALLTPVTDDAARRDLVARSADVEAGLVDAWLGRHTYVADNDNEAWGHLWSLDQQLFDRASRREIDGAMNSAARPFTFDGKFHGGDLDEASARRLYRAFFGREIERDHAREARDALAATWSREERFAGFINEGAQRVRLAAQSVSAHVKEAGSGVVDVEVHDVWVNQTPNDEEVALFFELPETAALTGLWLSPTSNKDDGAAYVVAPRGAAQQLYNEEVRAHRDPALVEQVGPRQYRLRVFPVPARPPRSHDVLGGEAWAGPEAPRVHVFLSYQALVEVDVDGAGVARAPLPLLRERRNGFWDDDTVRVVNGSVVAATDAAEHGEWVQGSVAVDAREADVVVNAVVGSDCLRLTPWPAPAVDLKGKTIDVVVDRSLSVAPRRDQLKRALATLATTGATLRFVLGTSQLRNEDEAAVDRFGAEDVDGAVFFGAAQPKELLQQLLRARGARLADAVVVLAGAASFDVADDSALDLSALPGQKLPPTLLVHLTEMPRGYDDATLDAVRASGGGATDDLGVALARLSSLNYVDGHRVDVSSGCTTSGAARAVVARQAILLADRNGKAPLDTLDRLHALAVDASVVTPYSSMIVLLDERQRERLRQLNDRRDRFDREIEQDQEKTDAPAAPDAPVVGALSVSPLLFLSSCAPPFDAALSPAEPPPPPPVAVVAPAVDAPSVVAEAVAPADVRGDDKGFAEGVAPSAPSAPPAPSAAPSSSLAAKARPAKESFRAAQAHERDDRPALLDRTANDVANDVKTDAADAADADAVKAAPEPTANFKQTTTTTTATTTAPPTEAQTRPQSVSGVPEPHEWLLVILAAVAVVVLARRRVA